MLTPSVIAAAFEVTSRLLHDDVFGHALVSRGERIAPGCQLAVLGEIARTTALPDAAGTSDKVSLSRFDMGDS